MLQTIPKCVPRWESNTKEVIGWHFEEFQTSEIDIFPQMQLRFLLPKETFSQTKWHLIFDKDVNYDQKELISSDIILKKVKFAIV